MGLCIVGIANHPVFSALLYQSRKFVPKRRIAGLHASMNSLAGRPTRVSNGQAASALSQTSGKMKIDFGSHRLELIVKFWQNIRNTVCPTLEKIEESNELLLP